MPVPTLTLRLVKGSPLTPLEGDTNFKLLRDFSNGLESLVLVAINPNGTLKDGAVDREAVLVDRVVTQRKLSFISSFYAVSGGAANAYTAAFVPPITGGYLEGMVFYIKANHTNTGAATLDVDGQGAIAIRKAYNDPLNAGDIQANQVFAVAYESGGPYWQIFNTLPLIPGLTGLGAPLQLPRTNSGATAVEWFTAFYSSAAASDNRALIAGFADEVWAHGLAKVPDIVQVSIVLTGTDAATGFATGDVVQMLGEESTQNSSYFCVYKNATNVGAVYDGSMTLNVRKKTTGAVQAIDMTQWKLAISALAFSS